MSPRALLYMRDISNYGERFAVDQVRDVEECLVVAGNRPRDDSPHADVHVIPTNRLVRTVDRKLADLVARRPEAMLGTSVIGSMRLAKVIREYKPDVVYTMFGWNAVVVAAALRRSSASARFVFHAGGSDVLTAHQRVHYVQRLNRAMAVSDKVLFGSEFLFRRAIELGFEPAQGLVHYIGVDVPSVPPAYSPGSTPVLLTASRLSAVKGVDRTIRAVSLVRQRGWQIRLRVVGGGPEAGALRALTKEVGLEDVVEFVGPLSHQQTLREIAECDVFLQHNVPLGSGAEEALGGSLLEASARARPIVGTRSGGVSEAVVDGESGLLVKPGDVVGMAEAIIAVLERPAEAESMGRAGFAHVSTRHNADMQNELLKVHLFG